jgi:hypothetical protein
MKTIHRADLSGKPVCGSIGAISNTGAFVTCEKCKELTREPSAEEKRKMLESFFIIGSMK